MLAPPAAVESLKRSSCLPLVVSRGDGAEGNFEVRNAYGTVHCLQTGFLSESNLKDLGWLVNDAAPAMEPSFHARASRGMTEGPRSASIPRVKIVPSATKTQAT